MDSKECQSCHGVIEPERLEVLDTEVCSACAHLRNTPRVKGVTIWPHKTGSFVQVVSAEIAEQVRKQTDRRGQHSILFRHDQEWDGGTL